MDETFKDFLLVAIVDGEKDTGTMKINWNINFREDDKNATVIVSEETLSQCSL